AAARVPGGRTGPRAGAATLQDRRETGRSGAGTPAAAPSAGAGWSLRRCTRPCSQPCSELLGNSQRAPHAVLVKAPAPVGAAEVNARRPADLAEPLLRRDTGVRVHRVGVPDRADHLPR